jgi:hypothetical protein
LHIDPIDIGDARQSGMRPNPKNALPPKKSVEHAFWMMYTPAKAKDNALIDAGIEPAIS